MYVDGLWLSGITLNIDRSGLPIPEAMQKHPISVKLTSTQVNAIATLLGLGMRNGDLLFYTDEDLDKMIQDPENHVFETEYSSLTSGVKSNRRTAKVFTPAVSNESISKDAWKVDDSLKDANAGYLTLEDVNREEETSDSHEFSQEDLDNLNIDRCIQGD